METKRDELLTICQQAMNLLRPAEPYTQADVIGMMSHLGTSIGESTFSELLKNGKGGPKMLASVSAALRQLVRDELGMEWADGSFTKIAGADFIPKKTPTKNLATGKKGHIPFDEGRLEVEKKIGFFQGAQEEVIEFGTTLNKFSTNLYSNPKEAFREHIENLLAKKVNFKCYMVDPKTPGLTPYFLDRESVHAAESDHEYKIRQSIARLHSVQEGVAANGLPGSFEVFSYTHLPYSYFLAVDPATRNGKILVSPYLYGITRAASPTFIILRKDNPGLFTTYWDSLRALMKNAKRIIPA